MFPFEFPCCQLKSYSESIQSSRHGASSRNLCSRNDIYIEQKQETGLDLYCYINIGLWLDRNERTKQALAHITVNNSCNIVVSQHRSWPFGLSIVCNFPFCKIEEYLVLTILCVRYGTRTQVVVVSKFRGLEAYLSYSLVNQYWGRDPLRGRGSLSLLNNIEKHVTNRYYFLTKI